MRPFAKTVFLLLAASLCYFFAPASVWPAGPDWAATLGAGVAIAAPHAERIADSVGETVRGLRETADRAPRSVPMVSAIAAAVAALAALIALPWRRRARSPEQETARRSRRAA